MKLINKTAPPPSLVTYSNKDGASFDDMDADVKEDLQDALLLEQGHICGYCQQRIKSKRKMKIEHHCEKSICNGNNNTLDRRLDYTNLMAVCLGIAGDNLHCDSSKSKFNTGNGLPINVSPWTAAHINGIHYHSTGLINSTNATHSNEMNVILALNTYHLKELRKNIWTKVFALSANVNGGFNRNKMRRLTEPFASMSGNKYESAFPGLYDYMFRKFCL